jgi:hypothetical protein
LVSLEILGDFHLVDWRDKATELFPELHEELREVDNPMGFWIAVWLAFERAYNPQ